MNCKCQFAMVAMMAVGGVFGEAALSPLQEESANTNLVEQAREWVGVSAFAELQTAYLARGKVVDARPFSAQFVDGEVKLGDFGHAGGHAWSVTSLSGSGQGAPKRYAYNEVDYNLHYVYDLKITDEWTLENRVARQWVTLPGYHGDAKTICEWHAAQALHNPYVTPYYLLRHSCQPEVWSYWDIGAKRSFALTDELSFTVDFFGDCGDARHFTSQYGPKPNAPTSHYHGGLMALNLVLRLDWKVTDYLSLYTFVWQFDIVSDEARDTVKATKLPEARRDITVGGVGLALNF